MAEETRRIGWPVAVKPTFTSTVPVINMEGFCAFPGKDWIYQNYRVFTDGEVYWIYDSTTQRENSCGNIEGLYGTVYKHYSNHSFIVPGTNIVSVYVDIISSGRYTITWSNGKKSYYSSRSHDNGYVISPVHGSLICTYAPSDNKTVAYPELIIGAPVIDSSGARGTVCDFTDDTVKVKWSFGTIIPEWTYKRRDFDFLCSLILPENLDSRITLSSEGEKELEEARKHASIKDELGNPDPDALRALAYEENEYMKRKHSLLSGNVRWPDKEKEPLKEEKKPKADRGFWHRFFCGSY